ncbi:MAG: hypothetical protein LBR11_03400 [Deltaproteobacteria bacterium]|jgi:hypothetical protein|nr:hypothetical protein [Deltaproteobacteria bacterium]
METIISIASFSLFFLFFAISGSFWGRLILRVGGGNNFGYGHPLTITAFIAITGIFFRYLYIFTSSFNILYSLIIVLGLIGAIVELGLGLKGYWRQQRGPQAKGLGSANYPAENGETVDPGGQGNQDPVAARKNYSVSRAFFKSHDCLLVLTLMSWVVSLYLMFRIRPNILAPWVVNNQETYSLFAVSDYFRGLLDPALYGVENARSWNVRDFGSIGFLGLFSAARQESAMMAFGGYGVACLTLIGAGTYALVRKAFSLSAIPAFLIGASLVMSDLFVKLLIYPFAFTLTGIIGFLSLLLGVIYSLEEKKVKAFFLILFPIMYIFISYNVSIIFYVGGSIILGILIIIESSIRIKNQIIQILKQIFIKCIIPHFLAIVISFILVFKFDINYYSLFYLPILVKFNSVDSLLDPKIFLGIPFLHEIIDRYQLDASLVTFEWYYIFILISFLILMFALNNQRTNFSDPKVRGRIISFYILYVLYIVIYLIFYSIMEKKYNMNAIPALLALPLAFVPTSLYALAVLRPQKSLRPLFLTSFFLIIFVIISFMKGIYVYDECESLEPIAHQFERAHSLDRDKEAVIYDFNRPSINSIAVLLSASAKNRKYFVKRALFAPATPDFIPLLNERVVLYEDVDQKEAPIDRIVNKIYLNFNLHRYDYNDIKRQGIFSYQGIKPYWVDIIKNPLIIKMIPPWRFRGQDLILKFETSGLPDNPLCSSMNVAIASTSISEKVDLIKDKLGRGYGNFFVPGEVTEKGLFELALDYANFKDSDNSFSDNGFEETPADGCRYVLIKMDVISAENHQAQEIK